MSICQWVTRQLIQPVAHGGVPAQQPCAHLYPIDSIPAQYQIYSLYRFQTQATTLWTGDSKWVYRANEGSSQRDQVHYLEGTGRHNVLLQPKKVSSPGILPWRLDIPRCIQYQDNMSVSETVALLPQTLHHGMPSRTLCIPSQTTTHNKETSSCIQCSKALYHSRRLYTRIRTITAPPTDHHWQRRKIESRGDLGQLLAQKEVLVPGEMEGI